MKMRSGTGEGGMKWLILLLYLGLPGMLFAADDAQRFLQQAKRLYENGEFRGAVIELKNALQENPSLAEARLLLGRTYLLLGDGQSAEKELKRAKALGMEGAELQVALAEAFVKQRRFEDVLAQLESLAEASKELEGRAFTLRGIAQLGLDRAGAAKESFKRALQVDPDSGRCVDSESIFTEQVRTAPRAGKHAR